jgi:hypothetical protein
MGLSVRQVKRLCRLFKDDGLSGSGVAKARAAQKPEARS